MEQTWGGCKAMMPKLCGWLNENGSKKHDTKYGFPPNWNRLIELYDALAADGAKGGMQLLDGVNKILSTRPQTVVHGDVNAGNFWSAKDGSGKWLLADWQALRMGPIAFDFITNFCTTDAFMEPGSVKAFLKEYHESLPEEIQGKYSLANLMEDCNAIGVTFCEGIVALVAGQIDGYEAMPKEKRDYTWEIFWPQGFSRAINLFDQLDSYDYNMKLAGLGPPAADVVAAVAAYTDSAGGVEGDRVIVLMTTSGDQVTTYTQARIETQLIFKETDTLCFLFSCFLCCSALAPDDR